MPIFMRVLEMPSRESEFWNGRAVHSMAIVGSTKLKEKEAAPKLVQILKEAEHKGDASLCLQAIRELCKFTLKHGGETDDR